MHPALRRIMILALFVAFLMPGLVQARSFDRQENHRMAFSTLHEEGFFSTVWNLLAGFLAKSDPVGPTGGSGTGTGSGGDNGGMLDPNGSTAAPENGGMLDPNGSR